MLNKPLNDVTDNALREHLSHIQEEGQGKIIELSGVPTATVPLLSAGEIGKYGNDVYWRIENTIFKIISDSQITVT